MLWQTKWKTLKLHSHKQVNKNLTISYHSFTLLSASLEIASSNHNESTESGVIYTWGALNSVHHLESFISISSPPSHPHLLVAPCSYRNPAEPVQEHQYIFSGDVQRWYTFQELSEMQTQMWIIDLSHLRQADECLKNSQLERNQSAYWEIVAESENNWRSTENMRWSPTFYSSKGNDNFK